jgi:CO dehydrogenase/acetyl-CoA synthase beta subunit
MAVTYTQGPNVLNVVQASLTANTDRIALTRLMTFGGFAIQITGTWTGTITFEVTVDGVNWVAFNVTPAASGTDVSTTTANGCWSKQNNGYAGISAHATASMTGTAVVTIKYAATKAP